MADAAVWITGTGPDKQLNFRLPTGGKGDKGDKGADGSNVLPTDTAIKDAVNNPTSETRGALNTTYAGVEGLLKPLDIWAEYRTDGAGGSSWVSNTYTEWIAGIDARLAGAGAAKASIGTDTNGATIWAYTIGPSKAPHALLVGGTHAIESLSQHAAMRYFTEYATNTDPAVLALRSRLRLTWIPTLTPSGYRASRENGAGTDVNRNFDYFWQYSPDATKGTAAMSSPGAQAIKTLLDTTTISAVIDCHTWDNTGSTLNWAGASSWTTTRANLVAGVAARWKHLYAGATGTVAPMGLTTVDGAMPQMANWAERYLRYTKGRADAFSAIVEARIDAGGSTSMATTTRQAMQWYCGFLHLMLAEWALNHHSEVVPVTRNTYAARSSTGTTVAVDAGGARIYNNTRLPITFDTFAGGARTRNYVDVAAPAPGEFIVEATVALQGNYLAKSHRITALLGFGPTPVAGGNVAEQLGTGHYQNTAASGDSSYASIPLQWRFPVEDINTFYRFQIYISDIDAPAAASATDYVQINRATIHVKFYPNDGATKANPVLLAI